jgi:peroxiredoxin
MAVIAPGTPAPSFTLARADGESFSERDLQGHTSVLVFYPFAFSRGTIAIQAATGRSGNERERRTQGHRDCPSFAG